MKWSSMSELLRTDFECVFRILEKRFTILKVFNEMAKVYTIDNVFVTCGILYNILLEADGFLDVDLPDVPYSLQSKLKIDPRGDGMWMINSSGE
jgi:hypothetical protein